MSDPLTAAIVAIALRAHAAAEAADQQTRRWAAQHAAERLRSVACVAEALYFEARGEGARGMAAVADVVENRVAEGRGPDECAVVREPGQFTYRPGRIGEPASWAASLALAGLAVDGLLPDVTGGATYYHASYVHPAWADVLRRTATIGLHRFYTTVPARLASR